MKKYSVSFYHNNREIHSIYTDELPLVGDQLHISNYIGVNAHRNGHFIIRSRNWIFDFNKEQVIDIHVDIVENNIKLKS